MITKERIDKLLVTRGFAETRTRAQALVMAGVVLVDEKRVAKASEVFASDASIRIKGETAESRYVGRGGLKLEAALHEFRIDPKGWTCIDVGSSTGGFTDCLLQHGAARVVAIDSGTNQLAWRLRDDERVEIREKTNARDLTPGHFDELFDLAAMDVSFISVRKIIPALVRLLKPSGKMIVLIKPQFEVGRGEVGKGGIVREPEKHERVVAEINEFVEDLGWTVKGVMESPILGAEGNKEFLAIMQEDNAAREHPGEERTFVEGIDFHFEGGLMVLTEHYLRQRGYCCESGCRHCPYKTDQSKKISNSSGSSRET